MSWTASGFVKSLSVSATGKQITRGEKLVLLILADYTNPETNYANPSINRLADEGLYERRQIMRIIDSLEEKGFITVTRSESQENNKYYISGLLMTKCHQQNKKLVTSKKSASDIASDISPSKMSPEPLSTIEPIKTTNTKEVVFTLTSPETEKKAFEIPEWLPLKEWDEWKQDRKERKIPTTATAQKKAIEKLAKLRKDGEDPAEVINGCILRGWRGIFSIKSKFQDRPNPPVMGEEEDALAVQKRREQSRKKAATSGQ